MTFVGPTVAWTHLLAGRRSPEHLTVRAVNAGGAADSTPRFAR
jgi:hypothetical protein